MLLSDSYLTGGVYGIEKSNCIRQLYEHGVPPRNPLETPNHTLQVELPCATTGQGKKFRELPEGKSHPVRVVSR